MATSACRVCGLATPKPLTGRPRVYCSTGSRRAAEYDIRRLSRRLESVERKRDDLELAIAIQEHESRGEWHAQRNAAMAAALDGQLERFRERLRLLLDDVEVAAS